MTISDQVKRMLDDCNTETGLRILFADFHAANPSLRALKDLERYLQQQLRRLAKMKKEQGS